ncbi:hypothetical protein [Vitiosangium sp. GDMCC 1.1324]|uniref:hypothetical protein n=1 Tax=Vitiosangium sp. (strain GDMCC 1.1324) TaxID=2138576 RepID=UPI00130E611E|nr:hypothetical protein [Vitiosangium sp. GDMCC 1.1324]
MASSRAERAPKLCATSPYFPEVRTWGSERSARTTKARISLARTDGARKDILELCTHTPRKSGNTIDLYTTFRWEALCAEVAKLKVRRHERGQPARLALAASGEKENPGSPDGARGVATSLATVSRRAESFPGDTEWMRRESNP